jgi:hypothetical protein
VLLDLGRKVQQNEVKIYVQGAANGTRFKRKNLGRPKANI